MVFEEGWAASPLRWLMHALGDSQLARMDGDPGLVAAVDQHAAVLRDAIPLDRETLGDYLLGFLDELRHRGWAFTGEPDAPSLRLTAVCWLTRELDLLADGHPA
ncbi:DUF6401 family natural product biosynthesis protein [Nonomuraea gerenzanensis]|uniref:Uncharacterized protein n=1 Tax=Nonomuraea gerenzanensis TaxID=93944 RepID=A0A1M4EIR7_9ACTN|nr:DUF6401 family natural product biosynthesis protein [Nonomuraea gerenzanensis]UBU10324.1 DUF6401 family natural product biosynthesis protein [Nonomuraea gerenzanensis]SBO98712.1 FIG01120907: hypothetical protein [Nonomuraea gerenzanensis]